MNYNMNATTTIIKSTKGRSFAYITNLHKVNKDKIIAITIMHDDVEFQVLVESGGDE